MSTCRSGSGWISLRPGFVGDSRKPGLLLIIVLARAGSRSKGVAHLCAKPHCQKIGRKPQADGRAEGPNDECPIICLALSDVIAVVGTVTTVGTFSAQSSRIDFAI